MPVAGVEQPCPLHQVANDVRSLPRVWAAPLLIRTPLSVFVRSVPLLFVVVGVQPLLGHAPPVQDALVLSTRARRHLALLREKRAQRLRVENKWDLLSLKPLFDLA